MSNYITLLGPEDVRVAGNQMTNAASDMQRAAASISYIYEQHQRFMDDWLSRFDATLLDRISDYRQAQS